MGTAWSHRFALLLCLAVIVLAGVAVVGEPAEAQSGVFAQQGAVDADEIRIDVELRANGSATWTIEFWRSLEDDESAAAFESLRTDIETNPGNYTASFADSIGVTVDAASDATGREMAAEAFGVSTDRQSLAREYGVVRYRFEWRGFASVDDGELRAGDAIEGLYLDDGTRLLISWPDEYELASATPAADDQRPTAVIWRGASTDFITGEPRVVVTPIKTGPNSSSLAVIFGVVAVLTGLGGWLLRRRSDTPDRELPSTGSSATDSSDDSGPRESTRVDSDAMTAETTATDDSEPTADSESEASLLSNEEQVMRLLADNGGRMKQQTVVEELDWTDAKTSKVVSKLREKGAIESFRIGRENVLTRPDGDPLD